MKETKFFTNIKGRVIELVGRERVEKILTVVAAGNVCLTVYWMCSSSQDKSNMQLATYVLNGIMAYQAQDLRPEQGIGYAIRSTGNSVIAATSTSNFLRTMGFVFTLMNYAQINIAEPKAPQPHFN